MRTIPIAAAALLLLGGTAVAQTPRTDTTTPAPNAAQAAPHTPAMNPLGQADVSKIEGAAVYGSQNNEIGHISNVLIDPGTKKLDRLVVMTGGVLGVGGHRVALPLDRFSWDASKDGFKLAMTEDSLKSMPEWKSAGNDTTTH